MFQVRQDGLLVRHGDGDAAERNLLDEGDEVLDVGGLEGEVDGVDGLPAEGGVEHYGGERFGDGVAGDAVDSGGKVDVLDAVGFLEGTSGDLSGCGFFAWGGGCEGEGRAGTKAEDARDDTGLSHADADDGSVIGDLLQQAHEGQVVGEGLGGGDDLGEVRLEGLDALIDGFEVAGLLKVVEGDDETDGGSAEGFKQAGLSPGVGFGGFYLKVDEVEAGAGGGGKDLELGCEATLEAASVGLAAAGGDDGGLRVLGEEAGKTRERLSGVGEVVEAKLEEGGFLDSRGGAVEHLIGRAAGDGGADLADAGAEVLGGRAGHDKESRFLLRWMNSVPFDPQHALDESS